MPKSNKKRESTNKPITRKQRNNKSKTVTRTKTEQGKEDNMAKNIVTAVLKEYSKKKCERREGSTNEEVHAGTV